MLTKHVYKIKNPVDARLKLLGETSKRAREEKTSFCLHIDVLRPRLLNGWVFESEREGFYNFVFSTKDIVTMEFVKHLRTFLGTNKVIKSLKNN